jgi:hypothetical protein
LVFGAYKLPKVELVEKLPRTYNGKVLRRLSQILFRAWSVRGPTYGRLGMIVIGMSDSRKYAMWLSRHRVDAEDILTKGRPYGS